MRTPLTIVAAICVLLSAAPPIRAELPLARLTSISPPGGQRGTTVELTIAGNDLTGVDRLHFPVPGITATPKLTAAGQSIPGTFLVSIRGDVPPGSYDLRAIGIMGVTNPRTFKVGSRPETIAKPGKTTATAANELPMESVVDGAAEAGLRHYFRLPVHRDEPVVIDVSAAEIDSQLEPVLIILDHDGHEVAHSRRGLRVQFTPTSDEPHLIAMHDVLYRGGPAYAYQIAARACAIETPAPCDRSLPPAGAFVDWTGLRGSAHPLEPSTPPHRMDNQFEVAGKFSSSHDRDTFLFNVAAGTVRWIEVVCHRAGHPASPYLLLQRITKNEKGEEIAADVQESYESPAIGTLEFRDAPGDPIMRFEAKEAGVYRLTVRNLFRASEQDGPIPYYLSVRNPAPDFGVVAVAASPLPDPKDSRDVPLWTTLIRRGGATPINITVNRRDGFAGEIQLSVEGLPAGVTASPSIIAGDSTTGVILLSAAESTAGWVGPIHIHGVARIGDHDISHLAKSGCVNGSLYNAAAKTIVVRSRVTDEFMVAVSGQETSPLAIAAVHPATTTQPSTLPSTRPATLPSVSPEWQVVAGSKLTIPVRLTRRAVTPGPITIRLAGHPAIPLAKEVPVDAKAESASVELDLTQTKLAPGRYTLHVECQAKVRYTPDSKKPETRDVNASLYSESFVVRVLPVKTGT